MSVPIKIMHLPSGHIKARGDHIEVEVSLRDMGGGWSWVNLTVTDHLGDTPKPYKLRGAIRMDGSETTIPHI